RRQSAKNGLCPAAGFSSGRYSSRSNGSADLPAAPRRWPTARATAASCPAAPHRPSYLPGLQLPKARINNRCPEARATARSCRIVYLGSAACQSLDFFPSDLPGRIKLTDRAREQESLIREFCELRELKSP